MRKKSIQICILILAGWLLAASAGIASAAEFYLRADARQLTMPDNAVVITFDDGYRDNFELAFPVLAALSLVLLPLSAHAGKKFSAKLTGVGGSKASGEATFELSDDGNTLRYKLTVTNLENSTMAHIHMAPEGKDGPPVAWLHPSGPPPQPREGNFSGTLGEGNITAAGLKGPLEGKPLSALVDKINAGETYVNVHTKQMGGGEIRGTIRAQ